MGRISSVRITADTNVVLTAESPVVFNGFTITPTGALGAGATRTISVYADNSGTGTANLIKKYSLDAGVLALVSSEFIYTNGILCSKGIRIECDDWTGLEMFVLYS